jgi:predicted nucleotidyltransferase
MNINDIENNTIFLTIVGSTAYGTNIDTSDEDLGGVCIPTKESILGFTKFEQKDNWVDENGNKIDKVIYSINKAIKLLKENNPNMMDYLWMPERCIKILSPEWQQFINIRDEFISKQAYSRYQGYAISQLERVNTHKRYIDIGDELLIPPVRSEYGLSDKSLFPETIYEACARISSEYVSEDNQESFYNDMTKLWMKESSIIFKKNIDSKYYDMAMSDFNRTLKSYLRQLASMKTHFIKDEYIEAASKELKYYGDLLDHRRYKKWKKSRNPRRQEIEAKCGYDAKHLSHAIRLLSMGNEILSGKGVNVDRTSIDADYLRDIRLGNVKYEELIDLSNKLMSDADTLFKESSLPKKPNHEIIDKLMIDIVYSKL